MKCLGFKEVGALIKVDEIIVDCLRSETVHRGIAASCISHPFPQIIMPASAKKPENSLFVDLPLISKGSIYA